MSLLLLLAGCGSLTIFNGPHDSDSDTGVVPTGTDVIGLVEFTRLRVPCPACFDLTDELFVDANAIFHDARDGSWIGWMPTEGACSGEGSVPLANTTIDVGSFSYLQSGSDSISLSRTDGDFGPAYVSTSLNDSDFQPDAVWDVSVPEAPDGALFVADAVTVVTHLDSVSPAEMLQTNPADAFAALIPRGGQTFTWTPAGGGDFVVVVLDAYTSDNVTYLSSAICRGPDTGSLEVPGIMLSAWPSGALLGIGIYRYRHGYALAPDDSQLEYVSSSGVLGTGTLQ